MKKQILFVALAILGLASCSTAEFSSPEDRWEIPQDAVVFSETTPIEIENRDFYVRMTDTLIPVLNVSMTIAINKAPYHQLELLLENRQITNEQEVMDLNINNEEYRKSMMKMDCPDYPQEEGESYGVDLHSGKTSSAVPVGYYVTMGFLRDFTIDFRRNNDKLECLIKFCYSDWYRDTETGQCVEVREPATFYYKDVELVFLPTVYHSRTPSR